MNELINLGSMFWDLLKRFDLIAFLALIVATKTYRIQQYGVEIIVYPYQEKHGDYGIVIENIGKGTAVDYTFKVLDYDKNVDTKIKDFLDNHKLLNGEARITLAGGKMHHIKIGSQWNVEIEKEYHGEQEPTKEYFPTLEIQILKWKHTRNYEPMGKTAVCDLKAFDGYPYTKNPIELLKIDMNYQAEKQIRSEKPHEKTPLFKDVYK